MKKKKLKKRLEETQTNLDMVLKELAAEQEQKQLWIDRCKQLQKYKQEALAARSERGGYVP